MRNPLNFGLTAAMFCVSCSVGRPDGAFVVTPELTESDAALPPITKDAGQDQRDDFVIPDAGTPSGDGGSSASQHPLAGSYLVRLDLYGAAQSSSSGATATAEARTSILSIASIQADATGLTMIERPCHFFSEPVSCTVTSSFGGQCSMTTSIDPRVIRSVDRWKREFVVEGQSWRTLRAAHPLGFNLSEGQTANRAALPTSLSDKRVWDINGDGTADGVLSRVTGQASAGPVTQNVDCSAKQVQILDTVWTGMLVNGQLGAGDVDSRASDYQTLEDIPKDCAKATPVQATRVNRVQLVKTSPVTECPAVSAFPKAL